MAPNVVKLFLSLRHWDAFAITWRPSSANISYLNLLLSKPLCQNGPILGRKHLWKILYKVAYFIPIR